MGVARKASAGCLHDLIAVTHMTTHVEAGKPPGAGTPGTGGTDHLNPRTPISGRSQSLEALAAKPVLTLEHL